jgi:outer membrane protein assembly factor BamB
MQKKTMTAAAGILLFQAILIIPSCFANWPMKQHDMYNTGRADYTVPDDRLNDTFFDVVLWQKQSPGSPTDGDFSSTSMSFFDGAGPEGSDIVVGSYHWPKGVQGMDRHTGALIWNGNPDGGENIGTLTPAFSNDGATIYVTNDYTGTPPNPLMAFPAASGPSTYWHNGADAEPDELSCFSPTVAPDNRIFVHRFGDRPYGGIDDGSQILRSWGAETALNEGAGDPALFDDPEDGLMVIAGGQNHLINAYWGDGETGWELWSIDVGGTVQASVTIDPSTGNIYAAVGDGDIYVAGLNKNGAPLWSSASLMVYDYTEGGNNPQRAQSTGCLSQDGTTYYFQTISEQGDGKLYAVNTADGSVKWSYDTQSKGWETWNRFYSSPIITQNDVIIIGNNENDTYLVLHDDGSQATLLDSLSVDADGDARASATIASDGVLYLPLRTQWTVSNGDGDTPSMLVENLFVALDISGTFVENNWPMKQRDMYNTGRAEYSVPAARMNDTFFNFYLWQKPTPAWEPKLSSTSMSFFDNAGPEGADIVVGTYHWPKGIQGMDRHTGARFWNGNPAGGETIGTITPAFSKDGAVIYVSNDATGTPAHPLMAFLTVDGPSVYWDNGADTEPGELSVFSPTIAPGGRIFMHRFGDRPYGGSDNGSAITRTWGASTSLNEGANDPALYQDGGGLQVVVGGQNGQIRAFNGNASENNELWALTVPGSVQASATIDPANGNIYVGAGDSDIYVVGLDKDGNALWENPALLVFDYIDGVNNPQRAHSTGCLSHDGATYYFQTISEQGDGRLYAVNTADGSLKWIYDTHSQGWETWNQFYASPIVTRNGVIIVGNNHGDTYFALKDDTTQATLLDTLAVDPDGDARTSATLAPDGTLYLPLRTQWSVTNGDGDIPTYEVVDLFAAFDLTEDAVVTIAPPQGVSAVALNDSVAVSWMPVVDPSNQFLCYAIYRSISEITSVAGMTAIATVTDINGDFFLDETAENGTTYYYAVTVITTSGAEVTDVTDTGPRTPRDETDLQVISISRTPRFPRYDALYTYYEVTEPSGYGPYIFSAATGLGSGQTETTARWPEIGDPVTYTATVRNRGTNTWSGTLAATWRVDGTVAAQPSQSVSLAPGDSATFSHALTWDGSSHSVELTVDSPDARSTNNVLAIDTQSVPIMLYVDASYIEWFREVDSPLYPDAVTDDFLDWVNYNMARLNTMFETAGSPKRVHYDLLEVLGDSDADPTVDRLPFAIFPFRFYAGGGSYRSSGYYRPLEDIDYGFLHEMGHQLGLIDLYQLDVPADWNQVSGLGYSGPDGLMHSCSDFFSEHSALAMTHWQDQAHGYFGQYMYNLPAELRLRLLDVYGNPLEGAAVSMYQYCERPGQGKVITDQVKAQGATDANGEFVLPNVAIDPAMVPAIPTGDTLPDNPFGYLAVVGTNGVLHFKVEYDGGTDYCWLDVAETNVAYFNGQTASAVFERQLGLGGLPQYCPPTDLTEANSTDWSAWAEGSTALNTYVEDDTDRKISGTASLKFVTDGGFDTYVRYPRTYVAHWDLSTSDNLIISFYAENPSAYGFQNGSPWIRLKDSDNNYFQYQYYQNGNIADILNNARDTWQTCTIPLVASATENNGWRRTVSGAPDLSHIQYIEIHTDTWDNGFTLWIDDVHFDPQPLCCPADLDGDGDVDGADLADLAGDLTEVGPALFAQDFGKPSCE